MPTRQSVHIKYPLPALLIGRCTHPLFTRWMYSKAHVLIRRDKKRGKPYALNATRAGYEELIYKAVLNGGERDPYTGDLFAWELIDTWDTSQKHPDGYEKQFALMPTVDHITPDKLEFEICTFEVNTCKSYLNPEEFVEFCKKVAQYRAQAPDVSGRGSNRKRKRAGAKSKRV